MLNRLHPARPARLSLLAALLVFLATTGLAGAADRVHHKVRKGETLYGIAKQYGVTVRELASANKMKVSTKLRVGRRLIVPIDDVETAEANPSLPEAGLAGDSIALPVTPPLPSLLAPVDGPVISPFLSPRGARVHKGIDIKAPDGTPIRAAADGIVRMSSEKFGAYGRLVVIEHAEGLATYYGHNQKNLVAPGQEVRAGDVIALVGHTGNASCDHLHFEVRVKGAPVNPEGALSAAPLAEVVHRQPPIAGQQ